jgi:outer membrane protein assembly factor BamB
MRTALRKCATAIIAVTCLSSCGTAVRQGAPESTSVPSAALPTGPISSPSRAGCGPLPVRHAYVQAMSTSGHELWRTPLTVRGQEASESLPPIISGGVVLAAEDGRITALDERTGRTHWTWARGKFVYGMWVNGDSLVVLTDQVTDAVVTALNLGDGHEVWRRAVPHGMLGNVVATQSRRLAWVRGDGAVQLMRMSDGQVLWSHPGSRSPALIAADGQIVFGAKGRVIAYDENTGRASWTIGDAAPDPSLTLVDGNLLSSSQGSGGISPTDIVSLDPRTGTTRWRFDNGASQFILGGDSGHILMTPGYEQLASLDARNGRQVWHQNAPIQSIDTSPLISSARVIEGEGGVASPSKPQLVARSPQTGGVLWAVPLPTVLYGAQPLLAAGSLVIAQIPRLSRQAKGGLSAYDSGSGRLVWSVQAPIDAAAPTAVHGSTLILLSADPGRSCSA